LERDEEKIRPSSSLRAEAPPALEAEPQPTDDEDEDASLSRSGSGEQSPEAEKDIEEVFHALTMTYGVEHIESFKASLPKLRRKIGGRIHLVAESIFQIHMSLRGHLPKTGLFGPYLWNTVADGPYPEAVKYGERLTARFFEDVERDLAEAAAEAEARGLIDLLRTKSYWLKCKPGTALIEVWQNGREITNAVEEIGRAFSPEFFDRLKALKPTLRTLILEAQEAQRERAL
jgi:hypothetical protein